MRMRKKKHRDARIEARADLLFVGRDAPGAPAVQFHEKSDSRRAEGVTPYSFPVFLEIGCGKGGFICEMAQNNPGLNFVAAERNPDVIILAMEKAHGLGLENVKFLIADALNLLDYFNPGQVAGIYLNFSDPWHKNYQAHKRLTYKTFLEIYKNILISGAKLIIKTDNKNLFDFSLRSLPANGFEILNQTRDLYSSGFLENNVQTEYEKKFVAEGVKICWMEAVCKK